MTARRALLSVALAALSAAGCASILNIPDRTLKWCDQSGNAHDFCEDFDHADAGGAWSPPVVSPQTTVTYVPSTQSPPNALDTSVAPLADAGESQLAAIAKAFPTRSFGHVVVEADIRIVQANFQTAGDLTTGAGFLLLADQPSMCIGLVATPPVTGLPNTVGIGLVYVPNNPNCVTVGNLLLDAGAQPATAEGGAVPSPLPTVTPTIVTQAFIGLWTHFKLDVVRNASDGSGTVALSAAAGAGNAPPLPSGSLGDGHPVLGLATTVTGPSGIFEAQFDNVTVDFR
jgi:hypothetical protein